MKLAAVTITVSRYLRDDEAIVLSGAEILGCLAVKR